MLAIQNKMVSNHKFNEKAQCDYLISELLSGRDVALVSDAGTPCISDPGHVLVKAAADAGIQVTGVCGASAIVTALSVSGFYFVSFAFYGFFPRDKKEIGAMLLQIKNSGIAVSVFFESPKRIEKTLGVLSDELPDSELCLCNDLTKMYEKIYRGAPKDVLDEIIHNPAAGKGEYTLVLQNKTQPETASSDTAPSLESMLVDYMVQNGGSMKDAVQAMQEKHRGKISKKEFYAAMLNLKKLLG
jgi:16S rRNA (cytidine1402-2'-O)-methyltransferase